jgi:hypothetical protein
LPSSSFTYIGIGPWQFLGFHAVVLKTSKNSVLMYNNASKKLKKKSSNDLYNHQFFNKNHKFFEGFKNNWNWQFFDPDFVTENKTNQS